MSLIYKSSYICHCWFSIYTIMCYNLITFMLFFAIFQSNLIYIFRIVTKIQNWFARYVQYIYTTYIHFIFKYIINICVLINYLYYIKLYIYKCLAPIFHRFISKDTICKWKRSPFIIFINNVHYPLQIF
jgi:hypothetical protein